ncbi:MAG: hypothetical protein SFX72_00995 [Isosphaeraceae bacterium]|nr:hypothetical protein [Isosphaeraceae bacterium]
MYLNRLFRWKWYFYDILLPSLLGVAPETADRVLSLLGRINGVFRWRRRAAVEAAARDAIVALGSRLEPSEFRRAVEENLPRYLARDLMLDREDEASIASRFEVEGGAILDDALEAGRGVILVGAHHGAHLAAIHRILRIGLPMRLLIQEPHHASRFLRARFAESSDRPQSRFFVRRDLSTGEAAERILLARGFLRGGGIVYLNGDIPWQGPSTIPTRLLGRSTRLLLIWAELASLTGAPVVFMFASHRCGGNYGVRFVGPLHVGSGEEPAALERFIEALHAEIAAAPADAVPYLTWPSFGVRRGQSPPPMPSITL